MPLQLEVSSHNPATQPTARGVEFLQLHRPFTSPGKVRVVWNCEEGSAVAPPWALRTTNVRRLRLYPVAGGWNGSCVPAAGVTVDSCSFRQQDGLALLSGDRHLVASSGCGWQLSGGDERACSTYYAFTIYSYSVKKN